MRYQGEDPEVGKYNGGQKLFFFAAALGAVGLLLSGVVMWFPLEFPAFLRELAILIHDVTFILFVVAIVFHIYLGTAAEPGTFHSMIRGTVSKRWARFHHPRWYREVMGEERRRP
jgi:formate dehydrogenase subunit gamma